MVTKRERVEERIKYTDYYIQNKLPTRTYCIAQRTIFNILSLPIRENNLVKEYIYIYIYIYI